MPSPVPSSPAQCGMFQSGGAGIFYKRLTRILPLFRLLEMYGRHQIQKCNQVGRLKQLKVISFHFRQLNKALWGNKLVYIKYMIQK